MSWFYMSFADAALPEGRQFLGGLYVEGEEISEAMTRSHMAGLNPGGEVQFVGPIPDEEMDENVPVGDRERLLIREELERV